MKKGREFFKSIFDAFNNEKTQDCILQVTSNYNTINKFIYDLNSGGSMYCALTKECGIYKHVDLPLDIENAGSIYLSKLGQINFIIDNNINGILIYKKI